MPVSSHWPMVSKGLSYTGMSKEAALTGRITHWVFYVTLARGEYGNDLKSHKVSGFWRRPDGFWCFSARPGQRVGLLFCDKICGHPVDDFF